MRRFFGLFAICVMLAASPVGAAETYDLIFKTGTLDGVSQEEGLTYGRAVDLALDEDRAERNTGRVHLSFAPEQMAQLKFTQGEKFRNLGQFPATVGNPIIMYFVETVLRDVAHQAGGSPFYIRNRIKDALVQPAAVEDISVSIDGQTRAAQQITLRPFEDDKNRDRMKGYGDLTLTFVMSRDVPGWYQSLVANVAGPDAAQPVYRNALTLEGSEVSK